MCSVNLSESELEYVRHEDVGSVYPTSTYLDNLQDEMKQDNEICMRHDLAVSEALWVKNMAVISVGVQSDGGIMFISILRNQYFPLIWILSVTVFYQAIRWYFNFREDHDDSKKLKATRPLNHPCLTPGCNTCLCGYVYKIILDGSVIGDGVNPEPIYAPTGPDLARWLEYASTSPFQVFLVATSAGCRDVNLIGALMALQSALVSYGYVIELMMDETYKKYIEDSKNSNIPEHSLQEEESDRVHLLPLPQTPTSSGTKMISLLKIPIKTSDHSGNVISHNEGMKMNASFDLKLVVSRSVTVLSLVQMRFFLVLSQAWLWHVVIWSILSQQFTNQATMYKKCNRGKTPPFVYAIGYGQFIFFSLFGAVQTFQYLHMLHNRSESSKPEGTKLDDESRKRWWLGYTKAYSILSVTSKLFLDITFLAGVWQLSTGNDTDSN